MITLLIPRMCHFASIPRGIDASSRRDREREFAGVHTMLLLFRNGDFAIKEWFVWLGYRDEVRRTEREKADEVLQLT